MCQPLSKGGKRCVAHHPATLAAKFEVKSRTKLEQGQIDYEFKCLREEGTGTPDPTPEEYKAFLRFQKSMIQDSFLSDTLKNRNIKKIDKAIESDQTPSGNTFYALQHLYRSSLQSDTLIKGNIVSAAAKRGISEAKARKEFKAYYADLVSSRGKEDLTGTMDSKTALALEYLREGKPTDYEKSKRITLEPTGKKTIVAAGYDPTDGRLEVQLGNGSLYAYHSVSADDYKRFQKTPTAVFNELRISNDHQYESAEEADRDAYRLWCDECQEYKVASGHICRNSKAKAQIDAIYQSIVAPIVDDLNKCNPNAKEIQIPIWMKPLKDRPQIAVSDVYEQEIRVGSLKVRIPSNSDFVDKTFDGSVVSFNARIESPTGMIDALTVPCKAYLEDGNRRVKISYDSSNAQCDCEEYKSNANGRCQHLNPKEEWDNDTEEMISNCMDDVTIYIHDTYFFDDDGNVTVTGSWDSPEMKTISLTGRDDEGKLNQITEEDRKALDYLVVSGERGFTVACNTSSPDEVSNMNNINFTMDEAHIQSFSPDIQRKKIADLVKKSFYSNMDQRLRNAQIEAFSDSWETVPKSREEYLQKFNSKDSSYLKNTNEFLSDYKESLSQYHEPIPFTEGSVTGGYLSSSPDEPNAKGFGVEIEFDHANIDEITAALYDEGIIDHNSPYDYHSDRSYSEWKVEKDGTVAGEIVSPILYDRAEDWEKLRRICEIAKDHGAAPSLRTGLHVHIGSSDLSSDQKKGILAAVVANQDTIRRIGTDPHRKKHRTADASNEYYTAPFDKREISKVYEAPTNIRTGLEKYKMVNFSNARAETVEFRDADGSLDPGYIQAQVVMSAALTSAGQRGAWDNLQSEDVKFQKVGFNSVREKYIDEMEGDEDSKTLAKNISLMTTLDALFPDKETKKRMLNVAVRSPWQRAQK